VLEGTDVGGDDDVD
jgi:hypothetical protein